MVLLRCASHGFFNSTEHFCSGVISTLFSAYVSQTMCNFELGILHFCCTKMVFLRMTYWTTVYTHMHTYTHIWCGMCGGVGVGVWYVWRCGYRSVVCGDEYCQSSAIVLVNNIT